MRDSRAAFAMSCVYWVRAEMMHCYPTWSFDPWLSTECVSVLGVRESCPLWVSMIATRKLTSSDTRVIWDPLPRKCEQEADARLSRSVCYELCVSGESGDGVLLPYMEL